KEALELGVRRELARIHERRRRHVLDHVGRPTVDRNAPGEEAIEELLADVAREARVLEDEGEAIGGQQAELLSDSAPIRALGRRVQTGLHGGMALLPAFAVEVEVIDLRK